MTITPLPILTPDTQLCALTASSNYVHSPAPVIGLLTRAVTLRQLTDSVRYGDPHMSWSGLPELRTLRLRTTHVVVEVPLGEVTPA